MAASMDKWLRCYNASREAELLSLFLSQLSKKSLRQQLLQQRISLISRADLGSTRGLLLPLAHGFTLMLNRERTFLQQLRTFGHELGHSFGWNIVPHVPERLFYGNAIMRDLEEEEFCNKFSRAWLAQDHNARELAKFLYYAQWENGDKGMHLWIQ